MSAAARTKRQTFATSRLLEFFSEKELALQIGVAAERWPLALAKELIDNALDACESAGIAPEIDIVVSDDRLIVADNGPGLPEEILTRSLDYSVRVSSNAPYVSPSRGQLGNALKCLWAAGFAYNVAREIAAPSKVEVEAHGVKHAIEVRLDRINQVPDVAHGRSPSLVKTGTRITLVPYP